MSTPILGPLSNGTRLQFAMEYDLPSSVDNSYGNIIITDSLPAGLSWYSTSNQDHKNKVFIGSIQQIVDVVFSAAGNSVTVTIPNKLLAIPANQGQKLYVEIDAVISNSSLIQPNTAITNNASLIFTAIDLTGSGSTDFMFVPLDLTTANVDHPGAVSPYSGNPVPIDIIFNASSDTEAFKYDIMCDFGENLVFDPNIPNSYLLVYYLIGGPLNTISPVTITRDSLNSNVFHLIFTNTPDIAGKIVVLALNPRTKYDEIITFRALANVPDNIVFKYSIQIGGAQSPVETVLIPVADKITVRKSVVGESPAPPVPQPITLTKNVITR